MEWLTVAELCEELKISRHTLDKWRRDGRAPMAKKLPNGQLRFRRADVEAWIEAQDAA